ncbi:enoyl-CoA hydratase-related protein [Methylocapsa sp. S129]|uniref:enoyl-CoA hydratase-related protein n=1 Tax=Methylocapsa sp. S129 TaxID=1641869 RepID=UPI00131CD9E6|nr:enoyl-CoA hydratase-related protein [Methylocapsa sp. S129]
MTDHIEIDRDGQVLIATLARTEKKNALTTAMYQALVEAFAQAGRDETIGAVLLRGKDGIFTAGNDIGDFLAAAGSMETSGGTLFIRALAAFEKPLIAAVDGPAIGIGTTLCFHCDLVYAAPGARFQMPFVNLGLVPEAGASLLAPQRFGYAKAAEFIMLAESFDAAAARDLGLVNAIVEPADLYAHALAKAQALAAKPRDALLATRRLLRGDPAILKARMDEELRLFGEAVRSPQARTAFMAFMQKKA